MAITPWAWRLLGRRSSGSASSSDSLNQLTQDGELERLLDQWAGGTGDKIAPAGRGEVSGGDDEAGEKIRAVLGQPVVQLDTRAVGHAEIRDHHLISIETSSPQFAESHPAVFRFLGIPAAAPQVSSQRRADCRLVVDNQRPASGVGGNVCG